MQKFLVTTRPHLSAETFYTKNKYEDFALETLEEKAILCGQQLKVTRVPGVFYSEKNSELTTVNLKITLEMFLSSIIDSF